MKTYKEYSYKEKMYLIYTLHCPFRCQHCLTNSSPARSEKMHLSNALQIIEKMIKNGIKLIQLTGGEIFTYYLELKQIIKLIYSLGACAMLETNGYWAVDEETTKKIMTDLYSTGLRKIMTSADNFHRKFVPFSNIENIWHISNDLGIENIVLYINEPLPRANLAPKKRMSDININFEENDLLVLGRSKSMHVPTDKTIFSVEPCDSLSLTILYNGDVFACCAVSDTNLELKKSPLYLGSIYSNSVPEILNNYLENKWLNFLIEYGHQGLYRVMIKEGIPCNIKNIRCVCDWCKKFFTNAVLSHFNLDKYL